MIALLDQIKMANRVAADLIGRSTTHLLVEAISWFADPSFVGDEEFMRQINERMFACEWCQLWCNADSESKETSNDSRRFCDACSKDDW